MKKRDYPSYHHISDNIFIGDKYCVNKLEELKEKNIGFILTCAVELINEDVKKDSYFKILRLRMTDHPLVEIDRFFTDSHSFISQSVEEKKNVMIHCSVGMSRSVTITVSYLMKTKGMSLKDAFLLVRSKRSIAKPNIGFFKQLIDYERALQRKNGRKEEESISIDDYKDEFVFFRKKMKVSDE